MNLLIPDWTVMDVLSALPHIQVALAGVVILARILLQVTTRRDRAAQRSDSAPRPADPSPIRPGRGTRSLQATVMAGQTAGAVMHIVVWLHNPGLI